VWARVDPGYAPIDWQLDFKSGHRWREDAWHLDIAFGDRPGVDVKVPWELARMQHLPQLAWAYGLAAAGAPGFEPAQRYAREVRNQVLDFIACNPPGYGVNWRCTMDVAIRVRVPIATRGEARGVKVDAGILEIIMREVEVECLPGDIPERIEIDVTDLGLHGAIRVSDLRMSEKVKVLDGPDQIIVHVVSVKEEVAPTVAAAPVEGEAAAPAAPAEPEVLKKGKKEEEPAE